LAASGRGSSSHRFGGDVSVWRCLERSLAADRNRWEFAWSNKIVKYKYNDDDNDKNNKSYIVKMVMMMMIMIKMTTLMMIYNDDNNVDVR
jgi:hypothetical protein